MSQSPPTPPVLKNLEELSGGIIASLTVYAAYEVVVYAILSGLVGGLIAHVYRIILAPLVEKLLLKLKKRLTKNHKQNVIGKSTRSTKKEN